ncbi:acyltransferase family protein [Diaminobutyricimonas sp. TR449]|uniref:acyltransferase family protein n=1 Tax=Diaminobutyricimonas sp. TR449 TaxID=2708076 RepID=UPI00141E281B|nr:acyltransferase family protein [Diaminobutyricimonas sp. TR449]
MTTKPSLPSIQAPAPAARSRIPGLDGLRSVAVVLVLVYHLFPLLLPGGYLGVDIFFVISGFLITTLLLREHERTGRIALGSFWRRRARRLLPAIGLLVVVCGGIAWLIGGDVLVKLGWQVLGATTFSFNWLSIADGSSYFADTTPELFRNLWSLAVEEQFYLLWPLAVLALLAIPRRRRQIRTSIVLGLTLASAIAMAVLAAPDDATRVYFGTDTHSFGLLLGAALAFASARWPQRELEWPRPLRLALTAAGWPALLGLVALAILMPADTAFPYRGGLVLVAVLTTTVIAASITPGARIGEWLDNRPMRWLGERSYGLYLWHWPVLVLLGAAVPAWHQDPAGHWLLGIVALAISVAAAVLSYRFVEQPIRRRGLRASLRGYLRWWRRPSWRMAAAAGVTAATMAFSAATVAAIATDPGQGSAQQVIEAGQQALSAPSPEPTPDAPQPLPGGEQITAVGDSVMLAVVPELQQSFPGISVDAVVSRQMREAPGILQSLRDSGALRPIVVLGLGTNGSITTDTLNEVRSIIGPERQLVLVNVQAPRHWTDGVNEALHGYADRYRDIELANWRDAIAPRLDLLAGDQIHATSAGGSVYVDALRAALQRLAELPPVLDLADYGLADLPQ